MKSRTICENLSVLSSEKRLQIVELLRERSLCAGAIARRLGVSSSVASQHLRVLRSNGFVDDIKTGYFVHYTLNAAFVDTLLKELNQRLGAESAPGVSVKQGKRGEQTGKK